MSFDERPHCRHLLDDSHFNEPNDARMREALHKDKFPEVLVFRNQYSLFPVRKSKQFFICCAGPEDPGGHDIVPVGSQEGLQTSG